MLVHHDFREKIIEKFIRVYEMGSAQPTIDCNRYMKFKPPAPLG